MKTAVLRTAASLTVVLLTLQLSAGPAPSAPQERPVRRMATIRVNDGTQIRGSIRELKDGVYTIDTESIGTITVNAQRILGISYEQPVIENPEDKPVVLAPLADDWGVEAPAPAGSKGPRPTIDAPALPAGPAGADVQQLLQQMLGNPEIMKMVEKLGEDPAIQKMVEDPALQKAIEGGDFLQLLRDPAVRKLMDNETVKQITEEVKAAPAQPAAKPAAE